MKSGHRLHVPLPLLQVVRVSYKPLVSGCCLAVSKESLDTEAHWKCISGLPELL